MRSYAQRPGEPLTRTCGGSAGGCHEDKWIAEFRILSNGYRCIYCLDCEAQYARERKRAHPVEVIPVGLDVADPETRVL
jgi:hypothetical protein